MMQQSRRDLAKTRKQKQNALEIKQRQQHDNALEQLFKFGLKALC